MKENPVVLVDASSFLFRAFHALPDLRAPDGFPTAAIYGVVNMLRRLLKDYDPRYLAVVFDAPGPTFRDDLYAEYKAHRPPMPTDLGRQIPVLHDLVTALGLPLIVEPGVEADDVIGTLARRLAGEGREVLIVTGDKDMAQLVDGRVRLLDTMSNRLSDAAEVEARFGVPPSLIRDYLALTGDAVDNVPGVAGVGPKTAAKWLQQYGSLEGVMAHADAIPGKAGENLRAALPHLPLSRDLVTIHTELSVPHDLPALARRQPDEERLRAHFQRLAFHSWLRELPASAPETPASQGQLSREHYRGIFTEADLGRLVASLWKAPWAALDTETTSLNAVEARLVGLSFAWEEDGRIEAVYIPVGHRDGNPQLPLERVLESLRPWLEDEKAPKIGQNLKYDLRVLANHGVTLRGIARDTMLESYVLNSTAQAHDLDTLAAHYLGHQTIHYEDVAGKGKASRSFSEVPVSQAIAYAAEDADVCFRLDAILWPKVAEAPGLRAVFTEIEMPLVPVLARMETIGVRVDPGLLEQLSRELGEEMERVAVRAFATAGQAFNLNSPKQIQEILFDKMGLPVLRKTPGGQPSTNEDVLSQLALSFDLPQLILDYRGLAKLKNTYADALPRMIDPATGRVHTSFQQAVAATGRLASSDPNLQNIPIRNEQGRRIRQAFVAEPGHLLLSADYSQIELRIMAHLSGDERLRAAFAEGRDIHTATAAEVLGLAPEAVSAEQRRQAKAINFGLIYGMSAYGLSQQLGIDQRAAQAYMERYFERYPGVRAYMERTREEARRRGYVETLFGRRLHVPEIRSQQPARRAYAERTAINAPMQGSAADLVKKAMIAMDAWLQARPGRGWMILQVHDELVLEVPEGGLEEARSALKSCMEGVAQLAVPLEVSIGVGRNWDEAH